MSTVPSLIIHVNLIFLNNSWNHSSDKAKSQSFASYAYLSSNYGIILMSQIPVFINIPNRIQRHFYG